MSINYNLLITPEMKQAEAMRSAIHDFRTAIQSMIDAKAQERDYDSGSTLASYVNSTIPQWASEAQTFVAWRDAVWLHALTELDKVQSGARSQPTVEGFLAELPTMDWPVGV